MGWVGLVSQKALEDEFNVGRKGKCLSSSFFHIEVKAINMGLSVLQKSGQFDLKVSFLVVGCVYMGMNCNRELPQRRLVDPNQREQINKIPILLLFWRPWSALFELVGGKSIHGRAYPPCVSSVWSVMLRFP